MNEHDEKRVRELAREEADSRILEVIRPECGWYQCEEPSVVVRTDLGGTAAPMCLEHAKEGDLRGYHRPAPTPPDAPAPSTAGREVTGAEIDDWYCESVPGQSAWESIALKVNERIRKAREEERTKQRDQWWDQWWAERDAAVHQARVDALRWAWDRVQHCSPGGTGIPGEIARLEREQAKTAEPAPVTPAEAKGAPETCENCGCPISDVVGRRVAEATAELREQAAKDQRYYDDGLIAIGNRAETAEARVRKLEAEWDGKVARAANLESELARVRAELAETVIARDKAQDAYGRQLDKLDAAYLAITGRKP